MDYVAIALIAGLVIIATTLICQVADVRNARLKRRSDEVLAEMKHTEFLMQQEAEEKRLSRAHELEVTRLQFQIEHERQLPPPVAPSEVEQLPGLGGRDSGRIRVNGRIYIARDGASGQ